MLGLDGAGKTTALYKLRWGVTDLSIKPTIGFNAETIRLERDSFTLFDIGGHEKIRRVWGHYSDPDTDAMIYVLDSTDERRTSHTELARLMKLRTFPLLVLANKQDLPGALGAEEVARLLDLERWPCEWHVQPAAAVTGDGLFEGLAWLSEVLEKREPRVLGQSHGAHERYGRLTEMLELVMRAFHRY